jgi:hypothetical protein
MTKRYLVVLAQALEAKWQLGNDTPFTSDEVENAPADDKELSEDEMEQMIDDILGVKAVE